MSKTIEYDLKIYQLSTKALHKIKQVNVDYDMTFTCFILLDFILPFFREQ